MGLGMGMGDSGDPPVSAVFSGEVVLSRRGSYAGSDGTGAGGSSESRIGPSRFWKFWWFKFSLVTSPSMSISRIAHRGIGHWSSSSSQQTRSLARCV